MPSPFILMLRSDPVADRVSKQARSHCGARPVSCGLSVCVLALLGLCAVADAQLVGGRWELVDNDPDHQANKREIGIWLQADRRVTNPQPHNQYDAKGLPLMALRCEQGKPEFFINLNFEVDSGEVVVRSQTDGDTAVDSKWTAEGVALEPGDKVGFVRSLLGKRQLALTITFPGATPTETSFAIAGLDRAIEQLRPHCAW